MTDTDNRAPGPSPPDDKQLRNFGRLFRNVPWTLGCLIGSIDRFPDIDDQYVVLENGVISEPLQNPQSMHPCDGCPKCSGVHVSCAKSPGTVTRLQPFKNRA